MKTTYTESEYQVRIVRSAHDEQEVILTRQTQDVIITEGAPCEVRGLRDDEKVPTPEPPSPPQ
ncbi:hypothetical protein [Thermocoleostomius sinensis]|jgi:hypothetical protein|uniref:Uncharacterized protein n=1 Tax=Thermocoleostomius sinensis A174 TaxID=2016057 RepID=A0A9E8ZK76_9CYAN|nr:hypothetical protein [Thermocoleostomius sinensis]WAL60011.1 hypothetical protein OXH18_23030 [Thermocoleostomius sinensis A174]